jgi:ribosomal protein S18 acetylase RimI-like enzyme
MAEALRIRGAGPEDALALAELGSDSFTATFAHLYRPEDLAAFLAETHSPERVARNLADAANLYFVAEDDWLQGYARLVLACGWPEHARGRKVVELKQLYTAPRNTGRGIGAALMSKVIEAARAEGADEIQLSVWQGNHGAQRFYARYGFERIAEIHFQVGGQTDDEFLLAAML